MRLLAVSVAQTDYCTRWLRILQASAFDLNSWVVNCVLCKCTISSTDNHSASLFVFRPLNGKKHPQLCVLCALSERSERAVNKDDNLIFEMIYVLRSFRHLPKKISQFEFILDSNGRRYHSNGG